MLEICKMLYMSTCHISKETNYLMETNKINDLYYKKIEDGSLYGYFIYTEQVLDEDNDVPEDLARCIKFARQVGCTWINMDCDYDAIDELPKYEW